MTSANDYKLSTIVTQCIQRSILKICNEQISFSRTLHVLGVLSLTIDDQEPEVIIKINDTIKRTNNNNCNISEEAADALGDSVDEESGCRQTMISLSPLDFVSARKTTNNVTRKRTSANIGTNPLLEDHNNTNQHDIEEKANSLCKMRGRKQRRPIKVNNKIDVVTGKRFDENCLVAVSVENGHTDAVNDTINSTNLSRHPNDVIVCNQSHSQAYSSDIAFENKPASSPDVKQGTEEEPLIAVNLIKRENSSPLADREDGDEGEGQINSAIDCMKAENLSRYFVDEADRNEDDKRSHNLIISTLSASEKSQFNDSQELSVRKLLTSNAHRPNSVLEHLEKLASFRVHNNLCTSEGERARTQFLMSRSRNIMSQISAGLSQPIVIEPIYQSPPGRDLHQQWSGCNGVQETPLNFSIQALNSEAGKEQQTRRSPNTKQQIQPGFSPPGKYNADCIPNTYSLNFSRTPRWPFALARAAVSGSSLPQTNYIYGSYKLPTTYGMLGSGFQSVFKQTNSELGISNAIRAQDGRCESINNGAAAPNFGTLFSQSAPNNHRLHPRRLIPGSLAWCPDKVHQKRIRKAIVLSSKIKKVSNGKVSSSETLGVPDHSSESVAQAKSSKLEGQFLVDSMSPETTRKRRRRGLDEALTADEIAEYMGVDCNGTTPSRFPCKYCDEDSPDLCAYLAHTVTVHGSYICHQCGKIFTTKSSLLRHRPIHTGMRRFTCSICQRAFYRKDKCKAHIKKHLEMAADDAETMHRSEGVPLTVFNASITVPSQISSLAI